MKQRISKIVALAAAALFSLAATASADEPYLGVYLTDESDSRKGALVEGVKKGSPAAKQGIKKGDYIVAFNGKRTPHSAALIKLLTTATPGSRISMKVSRGGWVKELELSLGRSNPEGSSEGPGETRPRSGGAGFLGVYLKPGADGKGALIDGTVKSSPARKVGLKKGDVVISCNGKKIGSTQDFIGMLRGKPAGHVLNLRVSRDGWAKAVKVVLGARANAPANPRARPAPKAKPAPSSKRGFLGISLEVKDGGLMIEDVQAGSPADKAGLEKGDVLLIVDGSKVGTIDGAAKAIGGKLAGQTVTMVISRDGWKRTIKVKLGLRPGE